MADGVGGHLLCAHNPELDFLKEGVEAQLGDVVLYQRRGPCQALVAISQLGTLLYNPVTHTHRSGHGMEEHSTQRQYL